MPCIFLTYDFWNRRGDIHRSQASTQTVLDHFMPGRSQMLGQLLPRVHRQIADLAVQIWHAYKSLSQSRANLALYYFLFFQRNQVEDRGAESKWMLLVCLFGS